MDMAKFALLLVTGTRCNDSIVSRHLAETGPTWSMSVSFLRGDNVGTYSRSSIPR